MHYFLVTAKPTEEATFNATFLLGEEDLRKLERSGVFEEMIN